MPQMPRDKRVEFMRGHPLSFPILVTPWTPRIGCILWTVSCTLLNATIVRRFCMVPLLRGEAQSWWESYLATHADPKAIT
jgi:hypothetical protein